MLLLALACRTPYDTDIDRTGVIDQPWDQPAEGLVFQEIDSLQLDTLGVWTVGDMDGDGDEDLVAMDADQALVLLVSEGGSLAEPVRLTPPLAEWLEVNQAWTRQLQSADLDADGVTELVLSVGVEEAGEWRQRVIVWDGQDAEVLAESDYTAAVNVVADLDGDGASELVLYTDNSAWVEFSASGAVTLPEELSWTWTPYAYTVDADGAGGLDVVVLNNGGYGIYQAWLLLGDGEGGLEVGETIYDVYGQDVVTDGDADRVATEVWLTNWNLTLAFDGSGFTRMELLEGDHTLAFGGELDGFPGADLVAWQGELGVGFVSDVGGLEQVPLTGLDVEPWGLLPIDLDGDGLDDLLSQQWEEGELTLRVFANVTR